MLSVEDKRWLSVMINCGTFCLIKTMKKRDLQRLAEISEYMTKKLTRNEIVSVEILGKISKDWTALLMRLLRLRMADIQNTVLYQMKSRSNTKASLSEVYYGK